MALSRANMHHLLCGIKPRAFGHSVSHLPDMMTKSESNTVLADP